MVYLLFFALSLLVPASKSINAEEIIEFKKKNLVECNPALKSWGYKPQFYFSEDGLHMAYSYTWENKQGEYFQFGFRTSGDGGLESIHFNCKKSKKMETILSSFIEIGFVPEKKTTENKFGKYTCEKIPNVALGLVSSEKQPFYLFIVNFSD